VKVYHHSRNIVYRNPQGAVPVGSAVTLCLDIPEAKEGAAFFTAVSLGGQELLLPMEREDGRTRVTLTVPDTPGLCYYYFVIRAGEETWYYGADSGEGLLTRDLPPAWQITVYRGDFITPQWFAEGLCYQIFPDRFFKSDPALARERVNRRIASGRAARLHEDWGEEPDYRPNLGRPYYAPDDYFGGDLNGITQKLPYLKELGVTCLYLNPVFEGYSNHRYNTADYLAVDRVLGSEADFDRLCRKARELGISLMLDGVFSHTGDDSLYFDRYGRYGGGACESMSSPYYPWYRFLRWPDRYECWWNFSTLPNVSELEPSYMDFIMGEEGVLAHWQRRGVMGWRLDVADELPDEFIRGLRTRVKQENPDGVLLGEVWEDCSNKIGPEGRRAYVDGDLLDSAMNYPFREAVLRFAAGKMNAFALNEILQAQRERYPAPFYRACLNLLSSHDEVRALSYLSGAPDRAQVAREAQAAFAPSAEDVASGKRRFLLATAIQMVHMGVPCLYYGDEIGLEGMADPFNRRTYPWGAEDEELLSAVKRLTLLRSGSEACKNGRLRMGALSRDVFAILRYAGDEVVILLVNASDEEKNAILYPALLFEGADGAKPMAFAGVYEELFSGETVRVGQVLTGTLAPCEVKVYCNGKWKIEN